MTLKKTTRPSRGRKPAFYLRSLSAWGLAGAVAAIALPARAQVAYTGANNGAWNIGTNWQGGATPGTGTLLGANVLLQNSNTVLLNAGDFTIGDVTGTGGLNLSAGALRASAPGKKLAFAGSLTMSGGTLDGFTIQTTSDVSALSGVFRAITLLSNVNLSASSNQNLTIQNGLTLGNGATITLNNGGYLDFGNTAQTLGGTGTIAFGNNTSSSNGRYNTLYVGAGSSLTIGNGITLSGKYANIAANPGGAGNTLTNNGAIRANVSGGTVYVQPSILNNTGTMEATNGANLVVSSSSGTQSGTLQASGTGSLLTLSAFNNKLTGNLFATNGAIVTLQSGGVLTNNGTIAVNSGGTLNLNGTTLTNTGNTITVDGMGSSIFLQGEAINGGAIQNTNNGVFQLTTSGGNLNSVTINGGVTTGAGSNAFATVTNGLTVNGTASLNNGGYLDFGGSTQSIDGIGTIAFGNNTSSSNGRYNTLYVGSGSSLTIGSGITLSGKYANIAANPGGAGNTLTNNGAIRANVSGGTVYVQPSILNNTGTMEATNGANLVVSSSSGTQSGTLQASGTGSLLTLSAFNNKLTGNLFATNGAIVTLQSGGVLTNNGTIAVNSGGTLNLNGTTLTNTGNTITVDGMGSSIFLQGEAINGGAIQNTNNGVFQLTTSGGNLNSVTINGGVTTGAGSNAFATVTNGLTVNGTASLNNGGYLDFGGSTQSIDGIGTIAFGNNTSSSNGRYNTLYVGSGSSLTIGSGITLSGKYANIAANPGGAGNTLTNNGAIRANVSGGTVYVQPSILNNTGTMEATNGANLVVSSSSGTQSGTLQASGTGSLLTLSAFNNKLTGNLFATNGAIVTLQSGGVLTNNGTIAVNSGGTLNLNGTTLTNTGNTITVDGMGSSIFLQGEAINGGAIQNTNNGVFQLTTSGGNLNSVTINGGVTTGAGSNAFATVTNGLTVNGTASLNNGGYLDFGGSTQSIDGTGTVAFGNNTSSSNGRYNTLYVGSGSSLTIGSGITLSGKYANIAANPGGAGNTLTNNGAIRANVSGGVFYVEPYVLNNTGTMEATNGANLIVSSSSGTQSGTLQASGTGSLLTLSAFNNKLTGNLFATNGAIVTLQSGGVLTNNGTIAVNSGGTLNLNGTTLTNTGNTITVDGTGSSILLLGETVNGGAVQNTNAGVFQLTTSGGNLNSVTINGGVTTGAGSNAFATVTNGLTVNGTASLNNGGYLDFGGSTQSIDGIGTVAFGNNTSSSNGRYNTLYVGSGSALTIGSGMTLSGKYANIAANPGGAGNTLTNNGAIRANVSGGVFYVEPYVLNNTGTMEATNGANLIVSSSSGTQSGTLQASGTGSLLTLSAFNNKLTGNLFATNGAIVTLQSGGVLTNNGTIAVTNAGTLNLNGTTLTNTGNTITVDGTGSSILLLGETVNGGAIQNTNAGVFQLTTSGGTLNAVTINGSVTTGSGSNAFATVTNGLTVNGTASLNNGGYLDFGNTAQTLGGIGTVAFGSNTSSSNGRYNTLYVGSGSSLTIGSGMTLSGKYADIAVNPGGAGNTLTNNGVITSNTAGGIFNVTPANTVNNGTLQAINGGTLNITGTITTNAGGRLSAGNAAGLSVINLQNVKYTNAGLLEINRGGQVNLQGGTFLNTGNTIQVASGGSFNPTGGAVVTGGTVTGTGGTLTGGSYDGTQFTGTTTVTGGVTVSGNTGVNGTVNVSGPGSGWFWNNSGGYYGSGDWNVTGGGYFNWGQVTNTGATDWSLQNGSGIRTGGGGGGYTCTIGGSGGPVTLLDYRAIRVNGTIDSQNGGYLLFNPNAGTIGSGGVFRATGGGKIDVGSNGRPTGLSNDGGNVIIGVGSTVTVLPKSTYTQNNGTTEVDGTLVSDGDLNLFSGTFYGGGTVQANVNNIGATVSPDSGSTIGGSAGSLLFAKKYTQSVGGTLLVNLGGSIAGTGYDVLNVTGLATLDGVLQVSLLSGYAPSVGDTWNFLNYGSEGGRFSAVNSIDPAYMYSVAYTSNTARLRLDRIGATAVPEASALYLIGITVGAGASLTLLRRRKGAAA